MHILEPEIRKLDLKLLHKRGVNPEKISDKKMSNVMVAYYEGIIRDYFRPEHDDEAKNTVFGRSIFCNYSSVTYYFGYTLGMERQGKGILVVENDILSQGMWK